MDISQGSVACFRYEVIWLNTLVSLVHWLGLTKISRMLEIWQPYVRLIYLGLVR